MSSDELHCQSFAPTRVDLAGGTLDIPPIVPILQEKFGFWNSPVKTVNVAINLFARVEVKLKKSAQESWHFVDRNLEKSAKGTHLDGDAAGDFPLTRAVTRHYRQRLAKLGYNDVYVSTIGEAPRGSGLGGSSSVVVALLSSFAKLLDNNFDKKEICSTAQNLEAGILGNLAGNQDHFAAAFGGVQAVAHGHQGSFSEKIDCNGENLLGHLVLAYSGQQHFSAYSNWQILQKALSGDKETFEKFARIAHLAIRVPELLKNEDWDNFGEVLSQEWMIRRTLAEGITTPVLDKMYEAAMKSGARGGKVCGAGGGGVLVMALRHQNDSEKVMKAVEAAGGIILNAQYSPNGVQVNQS